jgi:CO dehydrogenase maturation factor
LRYKTVPKIIAVAGKGGTGKTTICGMIVKHLAGTEKGHILAVDADPNSNLNEVLGVEAPVTLGDIREIVVKNSSGGTLPGGMTKQEYMDFMFGDALSEEDNFDLLVMGRTQGEGCYCFINGIMRAQIDKYSSAYSHIVIDNEAGFEHISRGTLPKVDTLILVSDCSRRGIQAAGRAAVLVEELKLKPDTLKLIVNRAPNGELALGILDEIKKQNLDLLGVIPQDEAVFKYDSEGIPSADVPEDSAIKIAIKAMLAELGFGV